MAEKTETERSARMRARARAIAAAGGLAAALEAGSRSAAELDAALREAHDYDGLSLVHLPVYCGDDPLGGMGAYGAWNVGNWCDDVQSRYRSMKI